AVVHDVAVDVADIRSRLGSSPVPAGLRGAEPGSARSIEPAGIVEDGGFVLTTKIEHGQHPVSRLQPEAEHSVELRITGKAVPARAGGDHHPATHRPGYRLEAMVGTDLARDALRQRGGLK